MRLIVVDGVQYDADNLPAHVDAKGGVPLDEWFAKNRRGGSEPSAKPKRRSAKAAKSE